MGFVRFTVVGLMAGLIACLVMQGGGYGILGDVVAGALDALLGGVAVQAKGVPFGEGRLGAVLVATFGAVLLVTLAGSTSVHGGQTDALKDDRQPRLPRR